jgi:Mg/Co/Ni transporter MgtE
MENKYVVKVVNVFSNLIEVEANNEEEAKQKAKEVLLNQTEEQNIPLNYDATLPEEHWGVITKEEFDKLQAEVETEQAIELFF